MSKHFLLFFLVVFSFAFAQPKGNEKTFQKFTGKVIGNKVRLRSKPDLEGKVIQQVQKDDLFLVVGDNDQFWAVKPSSELKAYVFRSYVLDGVVEANRVNVRLFPSTDAPIIGQLSAGEKVNGRVCDENHKWMEVPLPESARFYISKEYLSYAGSPDYYNTMCKRKEQVNALLEKAYTIYQEETKMPFEAMGAKSMVQLLEKIIQEYSDFSHQTLEAKKLLVSFQENYLEKKLAYIEEKSMQADEIKDDHLFPKVELEKASEAIAVSKPVMIKKIKGAMQFWDAIENSLYESWLTFHNNKSMDDFYREQKANSVAMTGIISSYSRNIQNRPGDYILKSKDKTPLAFIYSTKIDLEKYQGKQVKIIGAPRPNNHFAYPAFFVLDVQ